MSPQYLKMKVLNQCMLFVFVYWECAGTPTKQDWNWSNTGRIMEQQGQYI